MSQQIRKVYIAGPMTGIPQFNIPAFERAAARLRAAGFEVVSPVERDSEAVQAAGRASPDGKLGPGNTIAGETWGQILARDVIIVADEVDGVVVLPGWHKSRGARLEVFVALLCNKPVYTDIGLDVKSGLDEHPALVNLQQLNPIDIVFVIARSFL